LWFPLAREINGAKLETLSVPIITHHIHPLNWNQYARGCSEAIAFGKHSSGVGEQAIPIDDWCCSKKSLANGGRKSVRAV
jgi:hypothetical protein